jgi:FAD:protein FMN transferase
MGTTLELVVYAPSQDKAREAMDAGLAEINRLTPILSNYDSQSEISRLCSAVTERPVPISDDLSRVLMHSRRWLDWSEGKFDITVGSISELWRSARKQNRIPLDSDREAARSRTGWEFVRMTSTPDQGTFVHLYSKRVQLDISGIATGYIIDRAFEKITSNGCNSILLNIGGDIRVGDAPPGKEGWKISVAGLGKGSVPLMTKLISNAAVTSSGDVYQYVEFDGRRYSHFIDPQTGDPVERRQCVTVIASTTMDADAGATALAILGMEASCRVFENIPVSEAILVEAAMGDESSPKLRVLQRH